MRDRPTNQSDPSTAQQSSAILEVQSLSVEFDTRIGKVVVVDDVSFSLDRGKTLAIVGESGSGKSVSCMALMGLLPKRSTRITGTALLSGVNLIGRSERQMQSIRGAQIAMVFQEPMTSLNPVFTIGQQISEVIRRHTRCSRSEARERSIEALDRVGIPQPHRRIDSYPHEFSGGMRQRAMIAAALACEPAVLIADEPTTALDVTVQAQIMELVRSIAEEMSLATIWVTHDMGVVADLADDVAVVYAGQIVEHRPVHELFASPSHPYTAALLGAMPNMMRRTASLVTIDGHPPMPGTFSDGCRFAARCQFSSGICSQPIDLKRDSTGYVRCIRSSELDLKARCDC